MKNKVLYVKNSSSAVNLNSYNVQAVGLGKAFCSLGYDYDFLYFSKENKIIATETINGKQFRIITKKGNRILRSYYCKEALDSAFLNQYDFIISTEYGQVMTYCLSKKSSKVVMYSGPYYNLFKFPFVSPIYDFLFTKKINGAIKAKFVKSELAKKYLAKKGYTDLHNIGVALDIERFESPIEKDSNTLQLINYMTKHRCILYIGALSDRKNFSFLLNVYRQVLKNNKDVHLVVIGTGKKHYVNKCFSQLSTQEKANLFHVSKIENSQLRFIYPLAKAFLLPSKLEIFGMVLLEAMYLGAPIITSWNGGSSTLIYKKQTGQIIKNFDVNDWSSAVEKYLNNDDFSKTTVNKARELITNEFVWSHLAEEILNCVKSYGYLE